MILSTFVVCFHLLFSLSHSSFFLSFSFLPPSLPLSLTLSLSSLSRSFLHFRSALLFFPPAGTYLTSHEIRTLDTFERMRSAKFLSSSCSRYLRRISLSFHFFFIYFSTFPFIENIRGWHMQLYSFLSNVLPSFFKLISFIRRPSL